VVIDDNVVMAPAQTPVITKARNTWCTLLLEFLKHVIAQQRQQVGHGEPADNCLMVDDLPLRDCENRAAHQDGEQ
jgi:hypothetical protein